MYGIWKRKPSDENWNAYRSARNKASISVRRAKIRYFGTKLNSRLPPKQLWSNLKRLGVRSGSEAPCQLDADLLNEFFVSKNCPTDIGALVPMSIPAKSYLAEKFKFNSVFEDDVAKCVLRIKSNAVGADELPIKFIKIILPYILSSLTHTINHCFTTSSFPAAWKVATVTPIAKNRVPLPRVISGL